MGQIKSKSKQKADPLQCCMIKPPNKTLRELPCDDEWVYENSPTCQNLLQGYCGDKILQDDYCNKYCFRNDEWCKVALKDKIGYVHAYYRIDDMIKSYKMMDKVGNIPFTPFMFIMAPYTAMKIYPYPDFVGEPIVIENNSRQSISTPTSDINLVTYGSMIVSSIAAKNFVYGSGKESDYMEHFNQENHIKKINWIFISFTIIICILCIIFIFQKS